MTYTFSIQAVLAFDVYAQNEAEAREKAERRVSGKSFEPSEYLAIDAAYLRVDPVKPELEEVYDPEHD